MTYRDGVNKVDNTGNTTYNDGIITVSDMVQINHYYPFGMNMEGSWNGANGSNKYQYNGKEWNDDFGLGLNDYGARWYASDAPRWINVDPLSELRADVSPYQYVQNNPINAIDPTGMLDESFYKGSDRDASMRMRGENMAIENATWRMSFWDNYYNNAKLVPFGTRVEDTKGNVFGTPTIEGYNVEDCGCGGQGEPPCTGVGAPGTGESFIPIWGSGRSAVNDFQNGKWGWGLFNTGMAISDFFLLKSLGTAVGKGVWKVGTHSWSATRKWMLQRGYTNPGQPLHHWLIEQATAKKYGLEWLANQPWNMKAFVSQSFHMRAGHGMNYMGQPGYGLVGQIWYGTPTWPFALLGSYGGRGIEKVAR